MLGFEVSTWPQYLDGLSQTGIAMSTCARTKHCPGFLILMAKLSVKITRLALDAGESRHQEFDQTMKLGMIAIYQINLIHESRVYPRPELRSVPNGRANVPVPRIKRYHGAIDRSETTVCL